jgi:hypothetical protein
MLAQALEANGAIVYILGRRQEMLDKAAATAVRSTLCHSRDRNSNDPNRKMATSTPSRQMLPQNQISQRLPSTLARNRDTSTWSLPILASQGQP